MKKSFLTCVACLFLVAVVCIGWNIYAGAAGSGMLTVKSIDYSNSTITLQSTAGDSVAYFSDSNKKTWETAPGTFSNGEITFDISWISQTANYTLTFKGDKSTTVGKVVIPKQASTFKVKYKANDVNQPFTFTNAGSRTIEWRKDGTDTWNVWTASTTNDDLSYLKGNGATLYFRLAPVNGVPGSVGMRASKEVSVKIPAKGNGPTVTLNASTFMIPLTSKMSYRVLELDDAGNLLEESKTWTEVTSSRDYAMSELAAAAMFSGTSNVTTKPLALQVKLKATASAQESRVTTLILPAQEAAPTVEAAGAELAYTSSSSLEFVIKKATADESYEYCIVEKDDYTVEGPDYSEVSWTAVTSSAKVVLTDEKAEKGSHIYIRKKSMGTQGEDDFTLASDALDLTGASGVQYPDAMTVDTLTSIVVPAGVINKGDYGTSRSFTLYSFANTTVTSMEFKDGSTSYGTVEVSSVAAKNTNGDPNDRNDDWIITTKITSTENIEAKEAARNKELYATITLKNGEKIISNADGGVMLYLYSPTVIDNPENADKQDYGEYYEMYQTSFERIYRSNKKNSDETYYMDANTFKFILDFGTRYVMEDKDTPSDKELEISSISYDAYKLEKLYVYTATPGAIDSREEELYETLSENPEVMIAYEDYTNTDGKPARRAYVTVHVDQFESNGGITHVGSSLPFVVRLNNGEVLSDAIYMTLVRTATLDAAPVAWTIMENSLPESETVNEYDEDGKPISSVKNVVNNYVLTLTKMNDEYDVGVSDVTWKKISILYGASAENDKVKVVLSNAKINKLSSGDGSATDNVVVHFDNGYSVESGCKLTIIKNSDK